MSLALAAPDRAGAAPITWAFTGVVRVSTASSPEAELAATSLGAVVGAPVAGVFTYESTTEDVRPEVGNAEFRAVLDAEVSFSSWTLFLDPELGNSGHTFYVGSFPTIPLSDLWVFNALVDPTGTFTSFVNSSVELYSHDPFFFELDTLPSDPPQLADLVTFGPDPDTSYGTAFYFLAAGPDGNLELFAELTSLERVPEPGVLALLAPALAAALARSRRRS